VRRRGGTLTLALGISWTWAGRALARGLRPPGDMKRPAAEAHRAISLVVGGERDGDSTAVPTVAVQPRHRPQARVVVVHPAELAGSVALTGGEVVIGRCSDEGLSLPHPTLSRRHLAIRWERGISKHTIVDLGSKNGSSVDREPVRAYPRVLTDGAVIRAGEVMLVYEEGPGLAEPDAGDLGAAIPGDAAATRHLRSLVARAGPDPSHVLLIGETGTGKEHVARALHRLSGRRGPFLAVSCAELNPDLMAGQLFGHARGAFTGAHQSQPGLFRAADGGTLLLDEIGELAPGLQAKLLRVLQEGEVLPVGEGRPVRVDVRVVAATNADIPQLVEVGGFRRDLYARLAFWELVVPPLRARRADILGWVQRLHRRFIERRSGDHAPLTLDTDAAEAILCAPWPDNLRGLDRLVHRLASDRTGGLVTGQVVAPLIASATPTSGVRPSAPTREELEAALVRFGTVSALARHYGRHRRQIYRWLRTFAIR
jgi:hypothetical protein